MFQSTLCCRFSLHPTPTRAESNKSVSTGVHPKTTGCDSSPVRRSRGQRHVLLRAKAQAESSRHATRQRHWGQRSSHAFPLTYRLVSSHVLLIACSSLTMHFTTCFFLSLLKPGNIYRNNHNLKYTFSFASLHVTRLWIPASLSSDPHFTCSWNSSDLTNVAWNGGKGPVGCAFTHA